MFECKLMRYAKKGKATRREKRKMKIFSGDKQFMKQDNIAYKQHFR